MHHCAITKCFYCDINPPQKWYVPPLTVEEASLIPQIPFSPVNILKLFPFFIYFDRLII